jgi:hypothetical protein
MFWLGALGASAVQIIRTNQQIRLRSGKFTHDYANSAQRVGLEGRRVTHGSRDLRARPRFTTLMRWPAIAVDRLNGVPWILFWM